jgi:hypothetical protein
MAAPRRMSACATNANGYPRPKRLCAKVALVRTCVFGVFGGSVRGLDSMRAIVLALVACLALRAAAMAQAIRVGDQFEITRDIESLSSTPDGASTGSSTDRDTIVERVVASSPSGLELVYDLPYGTTPDDRARQWQLPVRVRKPPHGPLQLLDRPALEDRLKAWLRSAGLTQAACGHWYFTWNAFQIECDPQSALESIEGFDLGPDDLAQGAPYRDSKALNPAPVKRTTASSGGEVFHVTMDVDPDAVRRDLAEGDVVAGEILRKPVTLKDALLIRSAEHISGTIDITFETDAAGHVRRQTKVTTLRNIKGALNGQPETRTSTETLERRRTSDPRS